MRVDRLIGILTILLQNEKTTAPALAERFEVSRRTILRDIGSLCLSGIPIVTKQGGDGGISIMDGYKINKSVLTADELNHLVSALKGLDSISKTSTFESLMAKLAPDNHVMVSLIDSIVIDLSSHYKDSLSEKIALFKKAIADRKKVDFDYYYAKGVMRREIEPHFVEFRWNAWYVFGWCKLREDFRRFKLNRLWNPEVTNENYHLRSVPPEKTNAKDNFPELYHVKVLFDKSVRYRLIEAYGLYCFEETEDGLLLSLDYTNKEYIFGWILGFGDKANVLEPEEVRVEFAALSKNIFELYH